MSQPRKFHLFNCDNIYELSVVENLLKAVKAKLGFKFSAEKHNFTLSEMSELSSKCIPEMQMDFAMFVVHAHESVLFINNDNLEYGYAKVYRALMAATGDNVIVVIGGDDHYKDESEEEQSVISRWAWRKIAHCQFKEEFIDGRKSFVFSWAKKHRPIHEEALLHYFDPDKKGQKFEYQPKPKQGGSRKPAESLSPRSPWHKAQSMDEQRGEDRSFSRSNSVGQKGQDTSFSRTKSTEQRGEEGLLLRAYSVGPKGKDTLFSGTNIAGQRGEDGSPGYFNSAEEKTDESSFLPFNSSSAEQRREDSLKREHKTAQSTRVTKPRRNVAVEVPEQSSISCETQSGDPSGDHMMKHTQEDTQQQEIPGAGAFQQSYYPIATGEPVLLKSILRNGRISYQPGDVQIWYPGFRVPDCISQSLLQEHQNTPEAEVKIAKENNGELRVTVNVEPRSKEFSPIERTQMAPNETLMLETRLRYGKLSFESGDLRFIYPNWQIPLYIVESLKREYETTPHGLIYVITDEQGNLRYKVQIGRKDKALDLGNKLLKNWTSYQKS